MAETDLTQLSQMPPLLKKFEDAYDGLSKQHRRVCSFFLRNHLKASFLTVAEVAEQSGVSPATVIRFAVAMGFSGYAELQKTLQRMAASGTNNEYLRVAMPEATTDESTLSHVAHISIEALAELCDDLDEPTYRRTVEKLKRARRIVVVGHKASFGPAAHAAYVLAKVHDNVRLLHSINEPDSFSAVNDLGPEDVLLAFTVIYHPTATREFMRLAHLRGTSIVLVSDFKTFPEASLAEETLWVPIRFHGFLDQVAPMLAVADALAYGIYSLDEEAGKARLKRFNAFNEAVGAFTQIGKFSE